MRVKQAAVSAAVAAPSSASADLTAAAPLTPGPAVLDLAQAAAKAPSAPPQGNRKRPAGAQGNSSSHLQQSALTDHPASGVLGGDAGNTAEGADQCKRHKTSTAQPQPYSNLLPGSAGGGGGGGKVRLHNSAGLPASLVDPDELAAIEAACRAAAAAVGVDAGLATAAGATAGKPGFRLPKSLVGLVVQLLTQPLLQQQLPGQPQQVRPASGTRKVQGSEAAVAAATRGGLAAGCQAAPTLTAPHPQSCHKRAKHEPAVPAAALTAGHVAVAVEGWVPGGHGAAGWEAAQPQLQSTQADTNSLGAAWGPPAIPGGKRPQPDSCMIQDTIKDEAAAAAAMADGVKVESVSAGPGAKGPQQDRKLKTFQRQRPAAAAPSGGSLPSSGAAAAAAIQPGAQHLHSVLPLWIQGAQPEHELKPQAAQVQQHQHQQQEAAAVVGRTHSDDIKSSSAGTDGPSTPTAAAVMHTAGGNAAAFARTPSTPARHRSPGLLSRMTTTAAAAAGVGAGAATGLQHNQQGAAGLLAEGYIKQEATATLQADGSRLPQASPQPQPPVGSPAAVSTVDIKAEPGSTAPGLVAAAASLHTVPVQQTTQAAATAAVLPGTLCSGQALSAAPQAANLTGPEQAGAQVQQPADTFTPAAATATAPAAARCVGLRAGADRGKCVGIKQEAPAVMSAPAATAPRAGPAAAAVGGSDPAAVTVPAAMLPATPAALGTVLAAGCADAAVLASNQQQLLGTRTVPSDTAAAVGMPSCAQPGHSVPGWQHPVKLEAVAEAGQHGVQLKAMQGLQQQQQQQQQQQGGPATTVGLSNRQTSAAAGTQDATAAAAAAAMIAATAAAVPGVAGCEWAGVVPCEPGGDTTQLGAVRGRNYDGAAGVAVKLEAAHDGAAAALGLCPVPTAPGVTSHRMMTAATVGAATGQMGPTAGVAKFGAASLAAHRAQAVAQTGLQEGHTTRCAHSDAGCAHTAAAVWQTARLPAQLPAKAATGQATAAGGTAPKSPLAQASTHTRPGPAAGRAPPAPPVNAVHDVIDLTGDDGEQDDGIDTGAAAAAGTGAGELAPQPLPEAAGLNPDAGGRSQGVTLQTTVPQAATIAGVRTAAAAPACTGNHNPLAAAQPTVATAQGAQLPPAAQLADPDTAADQCTSQASKQQFLRLQQYLSHEVRVKAHCACEPSLVEALNAMSCIAVRTIAGTAEVLQQPQQELVQQYLSYEARVKAHCAMSSSTLVEALSGMSSIALRAITQQHADTQPHPDRTDPA